MTKWTPNELRPQGQPWPGLNTRGGVLDDARGWLEDGSKNCMINHADSLEKRKGMVRGLDEWFDGVVCGLFRYTDTCGREHLLVADETSIKIRQPFSIPTFSVSDAYPGDDFAGDGAIDSDKWRNTSRYVRSTGAMVLQPGAALFTGSRLDDSLFMRWFKGASSSAYRVRIQYQFAQIAGEQRASIIISGNGDLSTLAFLQADVIFDMAGTYKFQLFHRKADGTFDLLLEEDMPVAASRTLAKGFFTLAYNRDPQKSVFVPGITITPEGTGTSEFLSSRTLTFLQDSDLGLVSAIASGVKAAQIGPRILVVDGGPV